MLPISFALMGVREGSNNYRTILLTSNITRYVHINTTASQYGPSAYLIQLTKDK